MKLFITLTFLIPILSSAQTSKDTSICPCSYINSLEIPKQARDNNICGTIIVEIEVNTLGRQCNPKVIKGLGYGCDEAALTMVKIDITNRNECRKKCGFIKQKPEKLKQFITFICPEQEEIEDYVYPLFAAEILC